MSYYIVLRLEPTICIGYVTLYHKPSGTETVTWVVADKKSYFENWMVVTTWNLQVGEVIRPRRLLLEENPTHYKEITYERLSKIIGDVLFTKFPPKLPIIEFHSQAAYDSFHEAMKQALKYYKIRDESTRTIIGETEELNTTNRRNNSKESN